VVNTACPAPFGGDDERCPVGDHHAAGGSARCRGPAVAVKGDRVGSPGVGLADEVRPVMASTGWWAPVARVTASASRVTAAVRASVRPATVAAAVTMIQAGASTFERRAEVAPGGAGLPTRSWPRCRRSG